MSRAIPLHAAWRPSPQIARVSEGRALAAGGDLAAAIEAFDAAARQAPDDPCAAFHLGAALIAGGAPEGAIEPLERAVEGIPRSDTVWAVRGVALERSGRDVLAAACYRAAAELSIPRYHSEEALAPARLALADPELTPDFVFAELLQLTPGCCGVLMRAGEAHLHAGRPQAARRCFEAALEQDPEHERARAGAAAAAAGVASIPEPLDSPGG